MFSSPVNVSWPSIGHRVIFVSALFFALTLIVVLLALLAPAARNLEPGTPAQALTATPIAFPTTVAPAAQTSADAQPLAVPETALVAHVNGVALPLTALTRTGQVAQAMGILLGQPVVLDQAQQIDQLINRALVLQAAHAAGFALPTAAITTALEQWLAQNGKTRTDLAAALATADLTLADFDAEFARLVTVDRFISQQVATTKLTRADLLRHWQAAARISFGPAAQAVLITPAAAPTALPTALPTVAVAARAAQPTAPAPARIGPFTLWSAATLGVPASLTAASPPAAPPAVATAAPLLPPTIGLAPGNLAPTFTLPLLADPQAALDLADLRGQGVVLSFWTTWCPYCRKQTPVLVAGAQDPAAVGLHFIGVNVEEPAATVAAYVAEQQLSYPILLDHIGAVAAQYLVRGYPTTYFLDRNGIVVAKHVGVLDATHLARYVAQLAELSSAGP